jgi:hypothetical protein
MSSSSLTTNDLKQIYYSLAASEQRERETA